LEYGLSEGRAIVTLDADFHTILAVQGASKPSVVRIRIQGLRSKELALLIGQVLDLCATDLKTGAAISVGSDGIRVLPGVNHLCAVTTIRSVHSI
jgi:predicted nuclease of predicted toxin-antitoxin system